MPNVYRCFTEKMPQFAVASLQLLAQLRAEQGIKTLRGVRILCRYDAEGFDDSTYALAREGVFSEPACDIVYDEILPVPDGWTALCVESLPGQFDIRADSCEQSIAMITQELRPTVRAATVYLLDGELSAGDIAKIKDALINPVECREAAWDKPLTLIDNFPQAPDVPVLSGFISGEKLKHWKQVYNLAMDDDDLECLRAYFEREGRDPTETELRVIDTYWSDHCRHTTFLTELVPQGIEYQPAQASFDEYLSARRELYGDKAASRPVTLMDVATCAAKILKKRGILQNLDESEEVNACSVRITADVNGSPEPWLLMFKNETHNHPTEIEPFGGAATCLGGAIRDPLSGRAYVYQAMRVSGAADPRTPIEKTLPNKLPQRTICRKAAAGYSSYGNQIGLTTGLVSELYHPGYAAKRMEAGAIVAAAPESYVRRVKPAHGDVIVLLGGATGRDGCGGATGSSKSHSSESLTACGAEVQKGNAPEERKMQRLFRNPEATRLIKRCNDFGAGGVSVAVGELADGLDIRLDSIPKKYEGLSGTELAISESQERMAIVLNAADVDRFAALAMDENLAATPIATVTESPRMVMHWRGKVICDISREFLNSNGAKKRTAVMVPVHPDACSDIATDASGPEQRVKAVLGDLNVALQKGLGTRFDGSIGRSTVLMPFGGKNQLTPIQVMAAKLPVLDGETTTASVMTYGFDPFFSSNNPYLGAQAACLSSLAKLAAAGCDTTKAYFSFQEFFEKPGHDAKRIGKPFAALLGAFSAQIGMGVGAVGGKDSMSGTFNDIDVPPTLVSFAIAVQDAAKVLSPEFKDAGCDVWYFPAWTARMPDFAAIRRMYGDFLALCGQDKVRAAWAVSSGGLIEAVAKMAIGNDIGFELNGAFPFEAMFKLDHGGIVAQLSPGQQPGFGIKIGRTTSEAKLSLGKTVFALSDIKAMLTEPLEEIYPTTAETENTAPPRISYAGAPLKRASAATPRPVAIIPVFPGTNCEYDTKRAIDLAGGEGRIVLVRNLTPELLKQSVLQLEAELRKAQMLIIPGGFSGGDEPDGSGKFIQALLRNPRLTDAVHELLYQNDGLALGICNGFQALVKLGLLPFGHIQKLDAACPTLTFNRIGRHQSIYAHTRVASAKSPWLAKTAVGDVYNTVFSHGEGRFVADAETLARLEQNGQIALQYCDAAGTVSNAIDCNINGSVWAIESLCSPDGRILGKMGHCERVGGNVAVNIPGNKYLPLFEGGVQYFK